MIGTTVKEGTEIAIDMIGTEIEIETEIEIITEAETVIDTTRTMMSMIEEDTEGMVDEAMVAAAAAAAAAAAEEEEEEEEEEE